MNKPFLPVAAGELSKGAAWVLCLLLAAGAQGVCAAPCMHAAMCMLVRACKHAIPACARASPASRPTPGTRRRRGDHRHQLWHSHHLPLLLWPLPGNHLLSAASAPQALRRRRLPHHRHGCGRAGQLRGRSGGGMGQRARGYACDCEAAEPLPPRPTPHPRTPQCAASCSTSVCTTPRALRWACPLLGTHPSREAVRGLCGKVLCHTCTRAGSPRHTQPPVRRVPKRPDTPPPLPPQLHYVLCEPVCHRDCHHQGPARH